MGVVADQDTMFDQMKSTLFPLRSLRESRAIDVLQRVQHPSLMVKRNFIGASGTAGQGSKTEQKGTCGLHAERVTANRLGPAYLALRPIIPQSASNPSPPSWDSSSRSIGVCRSTFSYSVSCGGGDGRWLRPAKA